MRLRVPTVTLLLVMAVVGCQTKAPDLAKPSARPSTAAKASAAAVPITPPQLLKASGGVTLTGQVLLDAGYARAHADGRPLGQAIGMDGAHIISTDGASVANAGGRIVAQGGGNVIVPPALISEDAASLIGQDGSSLINQDGASLINQDGASIISTDGASYALAQADGGALGDSRPAAGMWLSVVDTRTGEKLPLGTDEDGHPVTTVYTDAAGKFKVSLPANGASNVRVVARAPGSTDSRLALHVLEATAQGEGHAVDEAAAATTSYLRYLIADLIVKLATLPPERIAQVFGENFQREGASDVATQAFVATFTAPLGMLRQALEDAKVSTMPRVRQYDVCLRAADRVLADMDLRGTSLDFTLQSPYDPSAQAHAGKPAIDELTGVLERLRVAAARKAPPTAAGFEAYFAAKPYLIAANAAHRNGCRTVAKPSDLCEFVVKEFLATADAPLIQPLDNVFYDMDLSLVDRDIVRAAGANLYFQMAQRLLDPGDGTTSATQAVAALIRAEGPKLAAVPVPAGLPRACPVASTPPAAPRGDVTTVAGPMDGKPMQALVEGPVEKARFGAPGALAYDAAARVLYVSELALGAVRRVSFDAAGKAVDVGTIQTGLGEPVALVLVGSDLYALDANGQKLWRFGTAAGAPKELVASGFRQAVGMILGADGDLLVGEAQTHQIRRVSLHGATPLIAPFWGIGAPGLANNADALKARLDSPRAMALAPGNRLYAASFAANQLMVQDLASGRTAFVAGGKPKFPSYARATDPHQPDGFYTNANLAGPKTMVAAPSGWLYLVDDDVRLRAISPQGDVFTIMGHLDPSGLSARGFVDGPGDQALGNVLHGLALLPDGSLLFSDVGNGAIRKWTPR